MVAKKTTKTTKSVKTTKATKPAKSQVKEVKVSAPVEEAKVCPCGCGCQGCNCCCGHKAKKFFGLVLLIVIVNILMMAVMEFTGVCPCHRGPRHMENGDRPCPRKMFFGRRDAKDRPAPAPVAEKK